MAVNELNSKVMQGVGGFVKKSALTYVTEDSTTPDPEFDEVLGQFIIVRPVDISEQIENKESSFKLIMPETVKETTQYLIALGRVIGIGSECGKREGVSKLNIGDLIIFPKNSGEFIKVNGVRCVVMYEDVPIARVDPKKITLQI